MAKYELYVVTTKNPDPSELESLKVQLSEKFGGLTVIDNAKGYWLNNGELVKDKTEIWIILSSTVSPPSYFIDFGEKLKALCKQKVQLVVVNGQPYYV
jgi:hypothetical protein